MFVNFIFCLLGDTFPGQGALLKNFFSELKRRNVVRVAIAYVVVSWVILQFVDIIQEIVRFPGWFPQMVLVLLIIGLPIALLLSWAYEVTPEGVKKTAEVDKSKSITHGTGQKINKLIIGGLILAVGFLLVDKFYLTPASPPVEGEDLQAVAEAKTATSIAVLPFVNMSNDPDQEYFSDGISEEILNVLVRIEGLSVASRTSSFAFKGRNPNISEIADELNVDHILEGSVRKAGNRVRITAQLIDVKTDRHLWSETYDRELTDIFKIQDEISNAIVTALKETLGMETLEAVSVKKLTDNMSAYEMYLKGRELFFSRDDLMESVSLLEAAVKIDPKFAQAWETLGAVYAVIPFWGFENDRGYFELSDQAALKALELDDNLSMAYAVLGSNKTILVKDKTDWVGGLADYDRALKNDPKNTTAYLWRGITYRTLGFFDRAIAAMSKCVEIDPAYENCVRHLAIAYIFKGDYETAVDLYNKGLETNFINRENAFVYPMLKTGNRAGALLLADRAMGGVGAPIGAWIRALESPDNISPKDMDAYKKWLGNHQISENSPFEIFLAFKDYDFLAGTVTDTDYHWNPTAKDWRTTEGYKRYIEEKGILDFWLEAGFPPQCQPVGDDDFECD